MALGQNLWLMQAASVAGLHGLTVLAILIGAAPATLATGRTALSRSLPPGLAVLALAGLAAFGWARIPPAPIETVAGVKLRLMQPNLPQDAKFNPQNAEPIMRRYLSISDSAEGTVRGVADVTHLVWPESAFPFLLHRSPVMLAQIAGLLPPGVTLITGAARMDDPLPGETVGRFFNSIQAIDDRGTIVASYDKVHLVPFGEYVPGFLDTLLRAVGLHQFVHIPGGFTAGHRHGVLAVPGLPPAAASVCYEAIFPGEVVPAGPRPSLLLNVTNDGWFGQTAGPYQHFAQARLRAVEEGLPLVRAANTGISAVVDPYGRVVGALPLGAEGVLDSGLPRSIAPPLFTGLGRVILAVMVLVCVLFPLIAHWQRRPVAARER
jgi:apolipoprotein N-acyltransferase